MASTAISERVGSTGIVSDTTEGRGEELTGRDRLLRNVLTSWGGYLVFVVAGFVMPRMIDQQIGQVSLGIWDFCWSIVSYMNVAGLGVGSSVNRYVARYRATNDLQRLRSAVSSVWCIQIAAAIMVALATAVVTMSLPAFFGTKLGSHTESARWVVAFLGGSIAVQMAFDTSRGVMTGCHRWDLHNALNAGSYAITVALMILSLLLGGGLRHLSVIYFSIVAATEVSRMVFAYRVCPGLRVRPSLATREATKEMLFFGGKAFIAGLPPLIMIQTTNILLATALGPAALAVFARPVSLVRHAETFLNKFAFVLTPTASSLQATGREAELRQFLLETARYGVAFTFPIILVLVIFGDVILRFWMGPGYIEGLVLAIVALGYFLPMSQSSVMRVLIGMNLHGKVGLLSVGVTLICLCAGYVVIDRTEWSLPKAAILISLPLMIANGVLVPILACRRVGVRLVNYFTHAFLPPLALGIAFGFCLALSRRLIPDNGLLALLAGGTMGGLVLVVLYWWFLFPVMFREKVCGLVRTRAST